MRLVIQYNQYNPFHRRKPIIRNMSLVQKHISHRLIQSFLFHRITNHNPIASYPICTIIFAIYVYMFRALSTHMNTQQVFYIILYTPPKAQENVVDISEEIATTTIYQTCFLVVRLLCICCVQHILRVVCG